MGILDSKRLGTAYTGYSHTGDRCFYCKDFATAPMVYWKGTFELYLHPNCLWQLTARLVDDLLRFEQQTGQSTRTVPDEWE